jgi:PiT family inorganic phosphate transporter
LNLFTWWQGIPSSSSHTLIGGFAEQPLLMLVWSSSWYKAGKDGGCFGVLIIVALFWHLIGSFDIFLMSICCLMPLRKVFIRRFSNFLMIMTIWFVESQMVYFDQIENLVLILILSVAFETQYKMVLVAFIVLSISTFCLILVV